MAKHGIENEDPKDYVLVQVLCGRGKWNDENVRCVVGEG